MFYTYLSHILPRLLNVLATQTFLILREWIILGQVKAGLDRHFPGDERPSILEMQRNVSAVLTFGHPLLMDGWRPTNPNNVYLWNDELQEGQPQV